MDEEYQIEEEDGDPIDTFRAMVYCTLGGLVLWAIAAATIYSLVMMD